MDEELISKKELLELTGISYGQLYRWKRKGLIPEDWFIRKSTYTGQETFFSAEPDADPRRPHTEYERGSVARRPGRRVLAGAGPRNGPHCRGS